MEASRLKPLVIKRSVNEVIWELAVVVSSWARSLHLPAHNIHLPSLPRFPVQFPPSFTEWVWSRTSPLSQSSNLYCWKMNKEAILGGNSGWSLRFPFVGRLWRLFFEEKMITSFWKFWNQRSEEPSPPNPTRHRQKLDWWPYPTKNNFFSTE